MVQKIVSFGFRHGPAPEGRVLDVRDLLRNPWSNRALRKLNGLHPDVQADIELTPDFNTVYEWLVNEVECSTEAVVCIGCTGGHHRSVYMAARIGHQLDISVEHRDLMKS